jgi:hypothetical protein
MAEPSYSGRDPEAVKIIDYLSNKAMALVTEVDKLSTLIERYRQENESLVSIN